MQSEQKIRWQNCCGTDVYYLKVANKHSCNGESKWEGQILKHI